MLPPNQNFWQHFWRQMSRSQPGCHNPSQHGNIVDKKFALGHKECQLISVYTSKLHFVYHYSGYFSFLCFDFFGFNYNSVSKRAVSFNFASRPQKYSWYLHSNNASSQGISYSQFALTGSKKDGDTFWSQYTYCVTIFRGVGGSGPWLSVYPGGQGPELSKSWLRNMCTLPNRGGRHWYIIYSSNGTVLPILYQEV